jgi:WD40 repeat protein
MQPVNGQSFNPDKSPQLATFTADAEGNLSTKSTHSNMPDTSVVSVTDLSISPSGKLLAVGGTGGLQIFHFNGGDPITHYTDRLTKDEIDQFFWDKQNHLYAISGAAAKLFVFTITPTSYREAPGSPYSISRPQKMVVQPAL